MIRMVIGGEITVTPPKQEITTSGQTATEPPDAPGNNDNEGESARRVSQ
jgi:hypothetical protein